MPFFEEMGKVVSQVGNDTIRKTRDFSDVTKLNTQISYSENAIKEIFGQIGRKYFEENAKEIPEGYGELFQNISIQMNKIEECRNQINLIKGLICCRKCGSVVSNKSVFCPSCGEKMLEMPAIDAVGGKVCSSCGAFVKPDQKFCTNCGKIIVKDHKEELDKTEETAVKENIPQEKEITKKYCSVCGMELSDEDVFCLICGTKVE